jgi:hypothetical protein
MPLEETLKKAEQAQEEAHASVREGQALTDTQSAYYVSILADAVVSAVKELQELKGKVTELVEEEKKRSWPPMFVYVFSTAVGVIGTFVSAGAFYAYHEFRDSRTDATELKKDVAVLQQRVATEEAWRERMEGKFYRFVP